MIAQTQTGPGDTGWDVHLFNVMFAIGHFIFSVSQRYFRVQYPFSTDPPRPRCEFPGATDQRTRTQEGSPNESMNPSEQARIESNRLFRIRNPPTRSFQNAARLRGNVNRSAPNPNSTPTADYSWQVELKGIRIRITNANARLRSCPAARNLPKAKTWR
ncbi:hypothetical protein B0H12DRAFT_20999 [Mycena haematopus]|nr:hypothetical protein B0H12DRAFT_20999 [Mycena haematopus]